MRPHRWQPTRLPRAWDSPGKNTGVGCHFLLQCMKVKSESEVAQSCPTLSDPWTAAHQAPPSLGFSRQEYWSRVPSPSPNEWLRLAYFIFTRVRANNNSSSYSLFLYSIVSLNGTNEKIHPLTWVVHDLISSFIDGTFCAAAGGHGVQGIKLELAQ